MKVSVAIALLAAALVDARPNAKRQDAVNSEITDVVVLNYALTLEHLENAFYHTALANFSQEDFVAAGLPVWSRGRFVQLSEHEQSHVDVLKSVLGANATEPCTYQFPVTDVTSFVGLSQVLEGVGTSAYAGAAQYLTSKDALTAAAVILSTEARHAAWVASAVNKQNPWSGAYDTPLRFNEVFTLAVPFIAACPETNPALPFTGFPALALGEGFPGNTVSVSTVADLSSASEQYVAFFSGLAKQFVPVTNGKVSIPAGLNGTVYAVLTNSNTTATDENTLAGPAILNFAFNSRGEYI
ncbi:ferritin-like domain-containing protein [Schizophyllum fasciatum]